MLTNTAHPFFSLHRRLSAGLVVTGVFLLAVTLSATPASAASELRVSAQGDCLNLRGAAGLSASVIGCVPDGTLLVHAGQEGNADGVAWTLVRWGEVIGWASSQYLAAGSAPIAPLPAATPAASTPATVTASRAGAAIPLRTPPAGGVTVGLVNLVSPKAIVDAQPFEVTSLSVYDASTQGFVTYIPGSPVNTIGEEALPANTAVFIRRRGELPSTLPAPASVTVVAGTPSILPSPSIGRTAAGLAGTGDLAALIAAQSFGVESVAVWDTSSQRWLIHIASAPEFVSTLRSGLLTPESVVFIRRSAVAGAGPVTQSSLAPAPVTPPAPTPAASATPTGTLKTVSYGQAAISFYYCSAGTLSGSVGDGGGFCGSMANGEVVHAGAASCAASYMGQRFLIAGDPLNRIYTCKDTGGAVTTGHRDIWFANADEGGNWWRVVGQTAEILVIVP